MSVMPPYSSRRQGGSGQVRSGTATNAAAKHSAEAMMLNMYEPTWYPSSPRSERGEEGYQVGSYMFNIIASALCFAAALVAVPLLTWPDPPWRLLEYGGITLMIVAPFVFYPFSKTLFLAFDLVFRPAAHDELT